MRHPIEIFDTPALGRMAAALEAAVRTVRLTGTEPDDTIRWEMAGRILAAAGDGVSTPLALAEAALHGWAQSKVTGMAGPNEFGSQEPPIGAPSATSRANAGGRRVPRLGGPLSSSPPRHGNRGPLPRAR